MNTKDNRWLTPLHRACASKVPPPLSSHVHLPSVLTSPPPSTSHLQAGEVVEVLLQHQADVNARDKYWRTPFHVAAASNSLGCAAALLARLANINITDRAGRSGRHHAAYCGHREMVELLVDRWRQSPVTHHPRGANVNAVDKRERRPLHWAAHTGCEDSLRALVAAGAEVRHLTNLPSPHGTSLHPPSPPGLALTSHPR